MPIAALWPPPPKLVAAPPAAPIYSQDDFFHALQHLMPRGRAWPRDPDAVQTKLLAGIATSQATAHARQSALLDDAFPATAAGLLPEWEATFGLPDPCIGTPQTVAARRALVVSRLAARGAIEGSQSVARLVTAAAKLGFTVTIEEFTDAAVDQAVCDQPLYGATPLEPADWARVGDDVDGFLADWSVISAAGDWAFALRVHAGGAVVTDAMVDSAVVDDPLVDWEAAAVTNETFAAVDDPCDTPLASWGAEILECTLRKIAPAESVLIFAYE